MMLNQLVVDISGYQGTDLADLARAGVKGVIIKFSEGTSTWSGSRAHAQAQSAVQHGILVVAGYDFARPGDGAAEAQVLCDAVKGTEVHVLCIDAEVPGIDANHVARFAQVAAANQYGKTLLYGSTSYIRDMYD